MLATAVAGYTDQERVRFLVGGVEPSALAAMSDPYEVGPIAVTIRHTSSNGTTSTYVEYGWWSCALGYPEWAGISDESEAALFPSPIDPGIIQHASFSVPSASLNGTESFVVSNPYNHTLSGTDDGGPWSYSLSGTITATFAPLAFTLGEAAAGNRAVASGVTRAAGGVGPYQVTFSTGDPGTVSVPMDMVAASFPDATMVDWVGKHAEWEISPIGDSHDVATYTSLIWDTTVLGDALIGEGDSPVATFSGLPLYNNDFGNKFVVMSVRDPADGHLVPMAQAKWQVFFPRDASNNPGVRGLPNWAEYWSQTFVLPAPAEYPAAEIAIIPGQTSWFYPGTNRIDIAEGVGNSCSLPPYNTVEKCGIDRFTFVMIHEAQHYLDWAAFWQNNKYDYDLNHAGKFGSNGDLDGDALPNWFEDVNGNEVYESLTEPYSFSEYKTVGVVSPHASVINDFEDWNYKRHADVCGYHDLDWANPGFQVF